MTEQTAQEPRPASEPAADGNAEPNGAVPIPGTPTRPVYPTPSPRPVSAVPAATRW